MNTQNAIMPFRFEEQAVRTLLIDGDPWFVAKDVCDILGHSNSRMALEMLDEDEKGVSKVYTLGGDQDMNIINESGLYNLIFRSNKPEAKAFRKWVTSEVLPTIRRTGAFGTPIDLEEIPEDRRMQLMLKAFSLGAVNGYQFQALIGTPPGDFQLELLPFRVTQSKTFGVALARDHAREFVENYMEFDPNGSVAIGAAYDAYLDYHGLDARSVETGEALSRHIFTRWLLKTYADRIQERVARVEGKNARCLKGMKFRTFEDPVEE
jgi:prophage antirepressor-like protein